MKERETERELEDVTKGYPVFGVPFEEPCCLAVMTSPPLGSSQHRTLLQSQPHPAALPAVTCHSLFPDIQGGKQSYGKDAGQLNRLGMR